jgi:hypothetical protein
MMGLKTHFFKPGARASRWTRLWGLLQRHAVIWLLALLAAISLAFFLGALAPAR